MFVKSLRIPALLLGLLLLLGLSVQSSSAASAVKVGNPCSRIGISALYQGQVLTCASPGIWKMKSPVKIGTNFFLQNILNDSCDVVNSYGTFSDITYICVRTPSGNRWEIASLIRTRTGMLSQYIVDKACTSIGLVTILNGSSYTCVYTQGMAQWQSTELVRIATSMRNRSILGSHCVRAGDITLLKGLYYYCAGAAKSSGTWQKYVPATYPKVIQSSVLSKASADLLAQKTASKHPSKRPTILSNGLSSGKSTPTPSPSIAFQSKCQPSYSWQWVVFNASVRVSNNSSCSSTLKVSSYLDCSSGGVHTNAYWDQILTLAPKESNDYSASSLFFDANIACRTARLSSGLPTLLNFNGPISLTYIG